MEYTRRRVIGVWATKFHFLPFSSFTQHIEESAKRSEEYAGMLNIVGKLIEQFLD